MTLHQQLRQDSVAALKNKDQQKRTALSFLVSNLDGVAKNDKLSELPDDRAIKVLQKQLKQRHETLEAAQKAGRETMAVEAKYEIALIENYLPAGVSEDEMKAIATEVVREINATSMKQMGQVMAQLAEKIPSADKSKLSTIVKGILSGK